MFAISVDNDAQLVGAVLWALWCLTLSMGAVDGAPRAGGLADGAGRRLKII
jgi:hypothetical protein